MGWLKKKKLTPPPNEVRLRQIVIVNRSGSQLSVMLEPLCDREDVNVDEELLIDGNFTENEELIIDYHDGHLSIWSPVGATLLKR